MARLAGRNARLYFDVPGGGSASPLLGNATFDINNATDTHDVTAQGDANHTYVAGLPDAKGTFAGFYDDTSAGTYTAALDGLPRKMYFYPNASGTPGQYFFGTVFADSSIKSAITASVDVSANWVAASAIIKVG